VTWLNPAAWAGVLVLAVPLIIHMLSRRSAQQRRFPTLRFFGDTRTSAIRRTRVTDIPLLLLRMLVLLFAVAALAQPHLLTDQRRGRMLQQTSRIVVVDTSASMQRRAASAGTMLEQARSTVVAQHQAGDMTVETATPGPVLAAAGDMLARRAGVKEIVVISDFQAGTVSASDITHIPTAVGVRMQRIAALVDGSASDTATASPPALTLYAPAHRHGSMQAAIEAGLEHAAPPTRLTVLVAGATEWPSTAARVSGDAAMTAALAAAMSQNHVVRAAAARLGSRLSVPTGALPVAWSHGGVAAALAPLDDGVLLVADTSELLVAALVAAAGSGTPLRERNREFVADSVLQQWQREAVAEASTGRGADSDGRWLWVGVLVLLLGEMMLRQRPESGRAAS
jgi:hypothetical protein